MRFNCIPPLRFIGHSRARRSRDPELLDGNSGRPADVTPALTVPPPIASPKDPDTMGQNRQGKPRESGFIDRSKIQTVLCSTHSHPVDCTEKTHFVNPTTLEATDSQACRDMCVQPLQSQQTPKLQIRLSARKWPTDKAKSSQAQPHLM